MGGDALRLLPAIKDKKCQEIASLHRVPDAPKVRALLYAPAGQKETDS